MWSVRGDRPLSLFLKKSLGVSKEQLRLAAMPVSVVDGFPGCGKSWICSQLRKLSYATRDLDDYSQPVVDRSHSSCRGFRSSMSYG